MNKLDNIESLIKDKIPDAGMIMVINTNDYLYELADDEPTLRDFMMFVLNNGIFIGRYDQYDRILNEYGYTEQEIDNYKKACLIEEAIKYYWSEVMEKWPNTF